MFYVVMGTPTRREKGARGVQGEADLALAVRCEGQTTIISATGEIDVFTVRQLQDAMALAMSVQAQHLTVNLSKVSFIDAYSMRVLVDAARTATRSDHDFRVSSPSPAVDRVRKLVDTEGLLTVES